MRILLAGCHKLSQGERRDESRVTDSLSTLARVTYSLRLHLPKAAPREHFPVTHERLCSRRQTRSARERLKSLWPVTGETMSTAPQSSRLRTPGHGTGINRMRYISRTSLSRQRLEVSREHGAFMNTMPPRDSLELPSGTSKVPETPAVIDGHSILKCPRSQRASTNTSPTVRRP